MLRNQRKHALKIYVSIDFGVVIRRAMATGRSVMTRKLIRSRSEGPQSTWNCTQSDAQQQRPHSSEPRLHWIQCFDKSSGTSGPVMSTKE
ncbi:hypothetical protein M758_11G062800 [Ceratodon purpureus]|nr:hypothetical protein M758_11G062800 [Ceratodon purpureus]